MSRITVSKGSPMHRGYRYSLVLLAVQLSGSPYQAPIAPPSPIMGVSNLGYLPAPGTGSPPSNPAYPPSEHGPDIYRAPSPYRSAPVGAPEQAILSRGAYTNPMNDLERRMDAVDLGRPWNASVGDYNSKQMVTHALRLPLLTRLACRSF